MSNDEPDAVSFEEKQKDTDLSTLSRIVDFLEDGGGEIAIYVACNGTFEKRYVSLPSFYTTRRYDLSFTFLCPLIPQKADQIDVLEARSTSVISRISFAGGGENTVEYFETC